MVHTPCYMIGLLRPNEHGHICVILQIPKLSFLLSLISKVLTLAFHTLCPSNSKLSYYNVLDHSSKTTK